MPAFGAWIRRTLGNTICNAVEGAVHWLLFKPNPIIQGFYVVVAVGCFGIYVWVGMIKHLPGPYLAEYHRYTGSVLMFVCYFSFYKACTVSPGIIKTK